MRENETFKTYEIDLEKYTLEEETPVEQPEVPISYADYEEPETEPAPAGGRTGQINWKWFLTCVVIALIICGVVIGVAKSRSSSIQPMEDTTANATTTEEATTNSELVIEDATVIVGMATDDTTTANTTAAAVATTARATTAAQSTATTASTTRSTMRSTAQSTSQTTQSSTSSQSEVTVPEIDTGEEEIDAGE